MQMRETRCFSERQNKQKNKRPDGRGEAFAVDAVKQGWRVNQICL